jgi:hypothetical protein
MPFETIPPFTRRRALLLLFCTFLFSAWRAPLAQAQAQVFPAPGLNIVVLTGGETMNSIRRPVSQDLAVRVEDEKKQPVAGAAVTFLLPDTGPSARFPDDRRVGMVTTNSQGEARVTGLRPNGVQGEFQIKVSASYQGKTASALITQTNVMALGPTEAGSSHKRLLIILGAAAGAGVAIALAKGSGGGGPSSSSTTPTPTGPSQPGAISITPGTPVVSGPH